MSLGVIEWFVKVYLYQRSPMPHDSTAVPSGRSVGVHGGSWSTGTLQATVAKRSASEGARMERRMCMMAQWGVGQNETSAKGARGSVACVGALSATSPSSSKLKLGDAKSTEGKRLAERFSWSAS